MNINLNLIKYCDTCNAKGKCETKMERGWVCRDYRDAQHYTFLDRLLDFHWWRYQK